MQGPSDEPAQSVIEDTHALGEQLATTPVVKSKNQMKRELKSQRFMENKGARRIAEKARRKARKEEERKAYLNNPDERDSRDKTTLFALDSTTNTIVSVPRFKLNERHPRDKLVSILSDPDVPTIVLDCRYEKEMTNRELGSLDKQLAICYGSACRAYEPSKMVLTGIKKNSVTDTIMQKHTAVESWLWEKHEDDVEEVYAAQKDRLVYLTAESENEIEELDPKDIYIIGGIVDHNRLKGMAHKVACEKGLRTARLPLRKYMSSGARVVLTIVSVFDILLAKKVMGWESAFLAMLPLRWSWKPLTLDSPTDNAAMQMVTHQNVGDNDIDEAQSKKSKHNESD